MIQAGIVDATGYMGGEALRVLLEHPDARVAWATSRSGGRITDHHPNLFDCDLELIRVDDATACDVVFLALPTGPAIDAARRWIDAGTRVIDLGAAFRLRDRDAWERVYAMTHPDWPLAEEAVYGISELHRDSIAAARLVANPGCFSSAAILGLAPLLDRDLVDPERLVVDGLSGTAGAGAELHRAAHHAEIGGNLVAYNVVDHRHSYEMEQELSAVAGRPVCVHFTPVYVPIVRGILDVCHAVPRRPVSRDELLEVYGDFYADHPFVGVHDAPPEPGASWQYRPYPWVSAVAGTNHCRIGLDVDPVRGRVVVFSVLDSIGKGGAQAAVENMNLMFGLERTAGLARKGLHP